MIQLTLDASVVFKWLAPDVEEEDLADVALGLLAKIRAGGVGLVQPVHWLAEVAAVAARLCPQDAVEDIANLYDMGLPIDNRPAVYFTAFELAVSLNQHLFDTLYHAVAMHNPDTPLVTADR